MHVATADHGFEEVIVEIGAFQGGDVAGQVILGNSVLETLGLSLLHQGPGKSPRDKSSIKFDTLLILFRMFQNSSVRLEIMPLSPDLFIALQELFHIEFSALVAI